MTFIQKNITRVAVIGGGPGGIAAARALRNEGSFKTITIFERNDHSGGTWKYTPKTNPSVPIPSTNAIQVDTTLQHSELYSPIYAHLHTNLPKPVMCFQDVPFPEADPLYLEHTQVFKYLTHIVEKENLTPLIKFSTLVENVEYHDDTWKLTVKKDQNRYTEEFDAVVVATGHYSVPYVPDIPGLTELNENKRIPIMHSRDYRVPDKFKDKKILVIGGGASALDLAREASSVATTVYQSIRTQTELSRQAIERFPSNILQVNLIKRIVHDQTCSWVELENGETIKDLDYIIFGTGYLYSFPFLPFQKDNLITSGQKVHNLDHYMFYKKNPTLCFLGLPIRVVPMPLMQRQSIVMARYFSGKIPMIPDTFSEPNTSDNRSDFVMGIAREVEYNERLGAWAEGWTDNNLDAWQSTHPITGRLSESWLELRKNFLSIRRQYLGY